MNQIKLLADENIPLNVCKTLLSNNIDIISIIDINKQSINDEKVCKISVDLDRVILTLDKDFGEIVFRKHIKIIGIILLRVKPKSIDYISNILMNFFDSDIINDLKNKFIIIDESKIRIRNL